MKKNQKVIIKKLSATGNPLVPTPPMEGYVAGQDNGPVSLPVEYTLKGILLKDVEVGHSVEVWRGERNGVVMQGYFNTSPVVKVEDNKFHTQNSVYEITVDE